MIFPEQTKWKITIMVSQQVASKSWNEFPYKDIDELINNFIPAS